MATVGWASLQIIPSMQGVASEVSRGLGGMRQAGQQAGQDIAQGVADGLKRAESVVAKASNNVAKTREAEVAAAAKVRVEEAKLQELRDRGITGGSRFMAAEERIRVARDRSVQATRNARAASEDLDAAQRRLANVQRDGADASTESEHAVERSTDAQDENATSAVELAKKLGGLAIAAAGIGSAMDLAGQSLEKSKIGSKLAAQFGETPAEAKSYGKVAGDLFADGIGDSMESVSEAVSAVGGTFGSLDTMGTTRLENLTAKASNFANVFDQDVAGSVQTAGILMQNGLAANADEAFDLMTRGMQEVSVSMRDELPEILQEYGTNFRALGFDGKESFNLLIAASQQGKFALDKTGDALKEFTIRGSDMSKASTDAFKSVGLDAQQMSTAIASGGDGAQAALQQTATAILGIQDPAQRANTAIALFGTPLEDLSVDQIPAFLQSLSGTDDAMGNVAGATDTMAATLNDNAGSALDNMKRAIQGELLGALEGMAGWVSQNSDLLKTIGMIVAPLVTALLAYKVAVVGMTLATAAWNAIQAILNGTMMLNPVGLIAAAIAGLVVAVVLIATKTTWFQDIWSAVWGAIQAAFSAVFDFIKNNWPLILGILTGPIGLAVLAIVKNWDTIKEAVSAVKDWIVARFNDVVGFLTGLPTRIKSAVSGLFDPIKDAFRSALNWLIGKWNDFSLGFDFKIPVINKEVSFRIDTPNLPMFAAGGVIPGSGSPTGDNVLGRDRKTGQATAWVSPKERVMSYRSRGAGDNDQIQAAMNSGTAFNLPAFAGGGVVSAKDMDNFAQGRALGATKTLEGSPYVWGGVNWGDCSGAVSAMVNAAVGDAPFGSRSGTAGFAEWMAAKGLTPGKGGPGSLTAAWFNGGAGGGHTAATLPSGMKIEMGGNRGDGQINGEAQGADLSGATDFAHLPAQWFKEEAPPPFSRDVFTAGDGSTPTASADPAATSKSATPAAPEKAFSGRDRFKSMFTDLGGIAANSLIEIIGVGDWLDLSDRYTLKPSDAAVSGTPSTTPASTPQVANVNPQTAVVPTSPADAPPPAPAKKGMDLYSTEIAHAAKSAGLDRLAAVIGNMTALVESGDPLKMFASQAVPESLKFPHDAISFDHDSVGLFQQRDNGAWGTVADRMDPFKSAGMFFGGLKAFDYHAMAPGDAAQQVQRSGVPGAYAPKQGRAEDLVNKTGLFDNGGMLMPGQFSYNALSTPEPILAPSQWDTAEAAINTVKELAMSGGPARGGDTYVTNATFRDEAGYYQEERRRVRLQGKQYRGRARRR